MKFYCITFKREYIDGGSAEQRFFVYAKTKIEAVKRFCTTTGNRRTCIISVYLVE